MNWRDHACNITSVKFKHKGIVFEKRIKLVMSISARNVKNISSGDDKFSEFLQYLKVN